MNKKIETNQIIQYMIDRCIESSGTFDFVKRVKMLRNFVYLELPELRPAILRKEKQLRLKAELKVMELFEIDPNSFVHPGKKMLHRVEADDDYYTEFDVFLNNIIEKHN